MRPKSLILLVLALGCGLVASIGINQVMAKRGGPTTTTAAETERIYVALADIAMRETLKPEILKLEDWPKDKIPAGALAKKEQVEGRRTRTKIYAGEPILEGKLYNEKDPLAGASDQIPDGYRLATVKVDDVSGSAKMILPGDRVDVQVYVRRNVQIGIPQTITATVLQNVKVFAVNDIFDSEQTSGDEPSMAAKTISLLVKTDEVKKVTLAAELGKVRLTLRSPDDKTVDDSAALTVDDLLQGGQGRKPEGGNALAGVLGFLQKEKETQVAQAPTASQRWTMRLLEGPSGVRQFEFADEKSLPSEISGPNAHANGPAAGAAEPTAAEPPVDASSLSDDDAPPEPETETTPDKSVH
jgi:pilus assembly protein CpaB